MKYQVSRGGAARRVLIGVALFLSTLPFGDARAVDKLETTNAILSFRGSSGDLIGVQWKRPRLEIIEEAKLGENFRILLPKPDYEASYFNSRDQALVRVEHSLDRVVLHYGPLKNEREEVDVKVAYEIRDTGTQLQFSIQIENDTDRPLAEVFWGIIGGQTGIDQRLDTESLVPSSFYGNSAPRLFSQFEPLFPFGSAFNYTSFTYPGSMPMGWMDVYNTKAGFGYYYANQDPETRVTALYAEMHPYVKKLWSTRKDNWPSATELPPGEPVGLTMGWVNFPYMAKGRFRAGPIALQVHEGDWHQAAAIYRMWFDQHFKVASEPNWLRKEMAWQSLNLLNGEDVVLYRFNDLPKLAADAKRYGVTTFQIFGSGVGGIDRGHPEYSPDPRLGTAGEFRKALADVRALGVHPLVYAKLQFADTGTKAFRDRLSRYAVDGRWAADWKIWGFGSGTIGGRTIPTVSRQMALLSPSHPKFREELIRQYLDRIQDGAEGLQYDGANWGIGDLDFNRSLPTSPDKSMPQGLLATYAEFLSRARKVNPEVVLSLQDSFDRAFPYTTVAYSDMSMQDATMAVRYTFPEWTIVVLAEAPGDFDVMNDGLRYGFAWGLAPRNHTASMDEVLTRPLSRYVSELIRIRKQYANVLFNGRFSDTLGGTVTGNEESIRYSIFRPMNLAGSQRACVVVNFGDQDEIVTVSILGKDKSDAAVSIPFEPDRSETLPVTLTVAPHRAAVIVSK